MKCKKCWKDIPDGSKFCNHCGAPQEKKLYALSDHIGCMSPANVEYLLKHNPEVQKQSVFVSPNSLEPREFSFVIRPVRNR